MAILGCCCAQHVHPIKKQTLLDAPNTHHVVLLQPPASQILSYAADRDTEFAARTEPFPQHTRRFPTDMDAVSASMSAQAIAGSTHVPHKEPGNQDDYVSKESRASVSNTLVNHTADAMPYLVCRSKLHMVHNMGDANNSVLSSQHRDPLAKANRAILQICPASTQGDLKSKAVMRPQLTHREDRTSKLYPMSKSFHPLLGSNDHVVNPDAFKENVKHTSALKELDLDNNIDESISTSQPVNLKEDDLKKDPSLMYFLDEEVICSTCLDGYDEENPKVDTNCGHHFHLACILEWAERSPKCPLCDKVLEFN